MFFRREKKGQKAAEQKANKISQNNSHELDEDTLHSVSGGMELDNRYRIDPKYRRDNSQKF